MLPKELRAALAAEGFSFDCGRAGRRSALERQADDQGALPAARRQRSRVGADAAPRRAQHDLHLEPGRLRVCVRVLLDRPGRLHAASHARPRSSIKRAIARGTSRQAGPQGHQRRVHGHGRTVPQLRRGDGCGAAAQRSARLRARTPAHHDLDGRRRAADRSVRGRRHPGQPRHLAARADRRGALVDHAGQPQVAGGGIDGRRRTLHRQEQPQSVLRVRDARRRERPARKTPRRSRG